MLLLPHFKFREAAAKLLWAAPALLLNTSQAEVSRVTKGKETSFPLHVKRSGKKNGGAFQVYPCQDMLLLQYKQRQRNIQVPYSLNKMVNFVFLKQPTHKYTYNVAWYRKK